MATTTVKKRKKPAPRTRKAAPAYPIGSVDNALRLLMLFRRQNSLRVSDAADHLGVARSTAHRLLAMLEYHDFVSQDGSTRLYVAGPALTDIGLAIVRDMDIRTIARPVMAELSRDVGETVHLLILRGTDAVFIDSIESTNVLRVGSRTGMVLPAHASAGGKVLLAQLSKERLRAMYPTERLDRLTGRTVGSRAKLMAEIEKARERGYAINLGESESGIGAVAAAIVDGHDRARASLAVAAPLARVDDAQMRRIARATVVAAKQIGERLA